jgi:PAS domain-containing protein
VAEELYPNILQATTDGFWLLSAEGKILHVNGVYATKKVISASGFANW